MATTITPKSRPSTPAPAPAAAQGKPNLSTPTSLGTSTAAHSDALPDLTVRTTYPLLHKDIEDHEQCGFVPMLTEFLKRCRPEGPKANDSDLLDKCLDAVLPICNSDSVKKGIKDYCSEAKTEGLRYPRFVQMFNAILGQLKSLKELPLRDPNEHDILFHTSDPGEINSKQNGLASDRKPDIVLVTYETANKSAEEEKERKKLLEGARKKPDLKFAWADVLCTFEFKHSKPKLNTPNFGKPGSKSKQPVFEYSEGIKMAINAVDNVVALSIKAAATARMPKPEVIENDDDDDMVSEPQPGTSSLKKRNLPAEFDDFLHMEPKRLNTGTDKPPPEGQKISGKPPIIQNASYAAEMLCRGVYTTHAITVLIDDDVAWLWWFDRQGAIQSTGINFIHDLPYFVLLLVAFQRFNLEDWGIIEELYPIWSDKDKNQKMTFTSDPLDGRNKASDNLVLYVPKKSDDGHWCLVGRGTRVMETTAATMDGLPLSETLFVKFSWPAEQRTSEARIVREARRLNHPLTQDRLPRLVASREYGYTTRKIREALHIKPREDSLHREPRELRVMVSHKLQPVLTYPEPGVPARVFMRFWLHWYQCHRILWINGIEHRDISGSNLMFHKMDPEVLAQGVLNDFDLAVYRPEHVQPGGERTGTIPYMALDLLTDDYFDGKVQRRYRHDLESFIWVLVAHTLKRAKNLTGYFIISKWINSSHFPDVDHRKSRLQEHWYEFPETLARTNKSQCKLTKALLGWLQDSRLRRLRGGEKFIEDLDDTVLEDFEKIVAENWPKVEDEPNWPIFVPMGDVGKANLADTTGEK